MGPLPKLAAAAAAVLCLGLAGFAPVAGATSRPPLAQTAGRAHRAHRTGTCSARAHRSARALRRCRAARRHRRRHPLVPAARPLSAATSPSPEGRSAQVSNVDLAAVLATPCQNTELTPEAGNLAVLRAAVLCLVNQQRAQRGVQPLRASPQLDAAAEGHCGELVAEDYFAHISPSGETPVDRIRTTGYIPGPNAGYVIGENLAWGTYSLATPQSIVTAWVASPGHLANILEGRYTETGIGITPAVPSSLGNGAPGATYAQEFGAITG